MCNIEYQGDSEEISDQPCQIDHTALAELRHRPGIGRIANATMHQQFLRKIVDQRLVRAHVGGTPSATHRLDRFGTGAELQRQRNMGEPLELLRAGTGHHQHGEFREPLWQAAVETNIFSNPLQTVEQLRTSQERNERAFDALARPGDENLCCGLLGGIHLCESKRRHAVWVLMHIGFLLHHSDVSGALAPRPSARLLATRTNAANTLGAASPP
ncbi:hypothetical protein BN961_01146 [Afipia felis]|uniref:Uncharacterized protein n=1 Tax=Afipia felis TaxID=1035 RepID=A0A090MJS4_AFIFE|nr:hypothetical protein BN961_01146 [Afipia felis]